MAIESLIIVAQESYTYQNDRIDVLYLTNMQIMTYDVILTSLWRHFRVWYTWRHCDVIFGQTNLKKIMEIAELKSFISYAGFFLLSLLEKKLQLSETFKNNAGHCDPPSPTFFGTRFFGYTILVGFFA